MPGTGGQAPPRGCSCPGFGSWLPPRSVGPTPPHTPQALGPGFPTPHTHTPRLGASPGVLTDEAEDVERGGGDQSRRALAWRRHLGRRQDVGAAPAPSEPAEGHLPTSKSAARGSRGRARSALVFPPRPSVRAPPLVGGRSEFRAADTASQATDTPRGQRPEQLDPGAGAVLPGAWVLSFLLPAGGTLAAASALRGKPAVAAHARRSPRLSAEERGGLAPAGRAATRQVGGHEHLLGGQQTHTFVLLEVKTVSESRTRVGMKKGR